MPTPAPSNPTFFPTHTPTRLHTADGWLHIDHKDDTTLIRSDGASTAQCMTMYDKQYDENWNWVVVAAGSAKVTCTGTSPFFPFFFWLC